MRERIVQFGPDRSLVGLLTPAVGFTPDRPAVLLLNSGVIHRVGPNRLHVDAARALAAAGFPVLRFDLSGIGDSAPRRGDESLEATVVADIGHALDACTRLTGATRFVCMGICLGADTGFRFAWSEPRVEGLVLLDPYTFRTWGFHVRRFLSRIVTPRAWLGLASGRRLRRLAQRDTADAGSLPEHYRLERAGQDEMSEQFALLVARGVRLLAVFTGGTQQWYNYPDQFRDAFPSVRFGESLELHHWPDVDHTLSTRATRQRLFTTTLAWLEGFAHARRVDDTLPAQPVARAG